MFCGKQDNSPQRQLAPRQLAPRRLDPHSEDNSPHVILMHYLLKRCPSLCNTIWLNRVSAVAWWLMPWTPDPEVGGSSPTRVKPCCVLEQGTFTPQKVLVIPRKRWLRPNMTEKLFTGTLRINQPTIWLNAELGTYHWNL